MDNELFYATAATVIPLLLIAVMATRSLGPGELKQQPITTVLVFGLPIAGEVSAFAFLFFEPVPAAAAATLAIVTWVGLISQLSHATWWLAKLIGPRTSDVPASKDAKPEAAAALAKRLAQRVRDVSCPTCGGPMFEVPGEPGVGQCRSCGAKARPF